VEVGSVLPPLLVGVDITHYFGRSACLSMVTVTFWCPGMSSKDVTTRLAAVSTRSLPLMCACLLIFCSIVARLSYILYWSAVTISAMIGLLWW